MKYQACVFVDDGMFKIKAPERIVSNELLGEEQWRGFLVKDEEEESQATAPPKRKAVLETCNICENVNMI
ncbi:MAG: hypothetical protein P1U85_21175 [Verrucomicrobiales bacterium]|nr:hypothetical protein [Verrucomicrobiales bacterium]